MITNKAIVQSSLISEMENKNKALEENIKGIEKSLRDKSNKIVKCSKQFQDII